MKDMFSAKPLIVLLGPTAVGKSRVAVSLAQALGTEILTADSRQVYRGMDIGMDKPSPAERSGVPHRLIDLVEPDQPFNVGEYRRRALAEIERLHREGRVPLVVGGTGLYVRALVRGLWEGPPPNWTYRGQLMEEARQGGAEFLYRRLTAVDPDLACGLHPHDQAKIIRALEAHHLLGRRLSDVHREHAFGDRPFTTLLIGLTRERASLYRAIDARVDLQLEKGLLGETQGLLARGYGRELGSMKGLGYRQMAGYLAGECSYEEAVRRLKRDTRHFAKRQWTWFKKEPGIVWIHTGEQPSVDEVAARAHTLARQFLVDLSVRSASFQHGQANPVTVEG